MPVKSDDDCVGLEFTIIREYTAPRELVFKACTEPRHLAQWWGPKGFTNPVCEWDAQPGGNIYVVMRAPDGTDYPMSGKVHEVVPPERLVTTTGALDEQGNLLFEFRHTLTLIESSGKTKLTMHSRVIMATAGAGKYIGGFETGMTMSLERLVDHLARKTEPLVVERIFSAPVDLVWRAISNLEDMKRWSFGLNDFKPEVGFEFEFSGGKDGKIFLHHCKVVDVILQKRLAYTWRYAGYPGDSLVTLDLLAEGAKTRVRLTHTGLETFPPIADFARENFVAGWTQFIDTLLREYVEKTEK